MSEETIITVSHGSDMTIDIATNICECGEAPRFNIGYGRMPYSINCACEKYIANEITCTTPEGAISAFNEWMEGKSNRYNFKVLRF